MFLWLLTSYTNLLWVSFLSHLIVQFITIKYLRNNHDKLINDISQTLCINCRTAKKYANQPLLPQPTMQLKRSMMYDEGWGDIVSLWLEEDYRLPKKKDAPHWITMKHYVPSIFLVLIARWPTMFENGKVTIIKNFPLPDLNDLNIHRGKPS